MVDLTTVGIGAGQVAVKAAQNSPWLVRKWKRWITNWKKRNTVITIFGAGGVGKTTTSIVFSAKENPNLVYPYKQSVETEFKELIGSIAGQIIVAPGQARLHASTWQELFAHIINGNVPLIINVVAYGYHDLTLPNFQDHQLFDTSDNFAESYKQASREQELVGLNSLVQGLSVVNKPLRIITLINKRDLWHDDFKEVTNYYENGDYETLMNKLRLQVGASHFQHNIFPISFVRSNIKDKSGNVLFNTVAGYDDYTKTEDMNNLIDYLSKYLGEK